MAVTTPMSGTSFPPTIDAGETPQTTSEGAVVVPIESTGEEEAAVASLPPTPAAKDVPMPNVDEPTSQPEGIEPAPHPQVDDVEGPVTTTIAAPAEETSMTASDSQGGLGISGDDNMDEISLGGGSVKGDGDHEEVDLS